MTRRVDTKTSELVEIALLTRAAFEQDRGIRYAHIAGIPEAVIDRIFARSPGNLRETDGVSGAVNGVERRKAPR